MMWDITNTWIVLIAGLSAASCALVGCWLLLRRMSMMGDTLSHSLLPGIVIAFMFASSRSIWPMLVGGVVAVLVTLALIRFVRREGKVEESASMGVVFTGLFAFGLLLIARLDHNIDLDLDCVLFGNLEGSALQGGISLADSPRAFVVLAVVFAISAVCVVVFYKEFRLVSFDEGLAQTLGFPPGFFHGLLMSLVALVAVASFEAVGTILVIGMLVVPPATARLLTDRLSVMLWLSVGIALVTALVGHVAAYHLPPLVGLRDTQTSGMMTVVGGLFFAGAFFFAPKYGVVGKMKHQRALRKRILIEDVLGILFRLEEGAEPPEREKLLRFLGVKERLADSTLNQMEAKGLLTREHSRVVLTDEGRTAARYIIRNHRLWEAYLAEHFEVPVDHLHTTAEALEHITDESMSDRLREEVAGADVDPHGKRIP